MPRLPTAEPQPAPYRLPIHREFSRGIVVRLATLFSLNAFGGCFVIQSLLALWLFRRFNMPVQAVAVSFFAAGLLGSLSQFVSSALAARIGRIRTMAYTDLPSNVLLILAALMPNATLTMVFLLLRLCLSQMDVPARQSYVMAMVPPEERAAAASVTNVPRSHATVLAPIPCGMMLDASSFGWPLICAGSLKALHEFSFCFGSVPLCQPTNCPTDSSVC